MAAYVKIVVHTFRGQRAIPIAPRHGIRFIPFDDNITAAAGGRRRKQAPIAAGALAAALVSGGWA
jgi:hypothetical protein